MDLDILPASLLEKRHPVYAVHIGPDVVCVRGVGDGDRGEKGRRGR